MRKWLHNLCHRLFFRSTSGEGEDHFVYTWRDLPVHRRIELLKKVAEGIKKMLPDEEDRY